MTIWKFLLRITDAQTVSMPDGARILTVATQYDQPCLWAIVDPSAPPVPRLIRMFGTGQPLPEIYPSKYIGTCHVNAEALVLHVFAESPRP